MLATLVCVYLGRTAITDMHMASDNLINNATKKTNYLIHTKLTRSGDCHVRRMVCMYTMINSKFMTEAIRNVRSFASPLCQSCSLQPMSACTPSTKHVHGDDAMAAAPWGTGFVFLRGGEHEQASLRPCTAPGSDGREVAALRCSKCTTRRLGAALGASRTAASRDSSNSPSFSASACSRNI